MIKRLQAIGNSSAIIIDKPILELLKIEPGAELDVSTDGERLIITPVRKKALSRGERIKRAQSRTIAKHAETFKKLAK